MASRFVFPSLERPDFRYRLYSSSSDNPAVDWRTGRYCLSNYISQYDTMGDGDVQHCADGLVSSELVMDVVFSLSCYLDKVPINIDSDDTGTEFDAIQSFWNNRPSISDEDIRFLNTLKYQEGKDTYYTIHGERKKSFSENKRYDKRWHKIPRPFDDSEVTAIERIMRLIPEDDMPHGTLPWIATVQRIAVVICPDDSQWQIVRHLKGDGKSIFNHPKYEHYEFMCCFDSISRFIQAAYDLRNARCAARRRRARHIEDLQKAST